MKRVILDTNFLLIPFTMKVDIFSELSRILDFKYKICINEKTIEELKNIVEKQRGKHKRAAEMALEMLKTRNFEIIKNKSNLNVDRFLIQNSGKNDIVATQDKELKQELLKRGIPVIVLRKKKYLNIIGI